MGATSKRAKKTRAASEFDLIRLAAELRAPKVSSGNYAWDISAIRAARDAQMRGQFKLAARLAESTRTDYAIFSSFLNRLAPQSALPVEMKAAGDTARALRIRDESDALFGPKGVGIHPDTLADIDGTLANHGVAFAVNVVTPRADGSRVDFEVKSWPIEFVRWNSVTRTYRTQVEGFDEEDICHGDGRWLIFQQHEHEPWKYGAILPVALLWADHAFGVRDRSRSGTAHGNAKVIGTMPQGIPLKDVSGNMPPEAAKFLQLLRDIASVETPVGIKPFGSTVEYITNDSRAWEIFKEIISSGDKAADRIYLGHDSTATAAGGDAVGYFFGVRSDIVEGSLHAIERGLKTGTIDPWTAVNFGDSSLAPERLYLIPDVDQDERRKSLGERSKAFNEAIDAARKNSFEITQDYVDALGKDFGVVAPKLKSASLFQVGARVKVQPGKAHDAMTRDKPGTVVESDGPALAVQFDGVPQVHKWYVADELQIATASTPTQTAPQETPSSSVPPSSPAAAPPLRAVP